MAEQPNIPETRRSACHIFMLQRFREQADHASPCLAITGAIRRQGDTLALQYRVSGDIGGLVLSLPARPCRRRHGLWQRSCFEVFFGIPGTTRYWEVNLAPGGDWNAYAFTGYREGMIEEAAISRIPSVFHAGEDEVWIDLHLDLQPLLRRGQSIEAGISAVLQHRDGSMSYWSLVHQGPCADFHRRSGFQLCL